MQIAVIGNNADGCSPGQYSFAQTLGKALVDAGHIIICGGLGGVMEAVCKGASESEGHHAGSTVGILPGSDKRAANAYVDIVIPTGLSHARNTLVAQAGDVVIAISGGAGTLSELAFGWIHRKPVIACTQFGGWSEKLAGERLDDRQMQTVLSVASVEEVMAHLEQLADTLE